MGRTRKGYLCLVPASTEVGDAISLFEGGKVLLIIRPEDRDLKLIGESYIHDIRNGEAFDKAFCKEMWFR